MSNLVQLATMTIDLSQVLEIRDDEGEEITLVIGPTDAVELLTLTGEDAKKLREWLDEDRKGYLEDEETTQKNRQTEPSPRQTPPLEVTKPPFPF